MRRAIALATFVLVAFTAGCSSSARQTSLPLAKAPDGFAISTASDVHNGKMSAANYDSFEKSGAAARDHLVDGNEVTYDAVDSSDYVQIVIARLASIADSAKWESLGRTLAGRQVAVPVGTNIKGPVRGSRVAGIPDAYLVDETRAESDGTYTHAILVTRGALIVEIDYVGSSSKTPSLLLSVARDQMALLPS
jgi:hypothetical protein